MSERSLRRLTPEEVKLTLGLFPMEGKEDLYFIPGFLIRVLAEQLEITYLKKPGLSSGVPDETLMTAEPFEYHSNGKVYFLHTENGQLVADEEEQVIGSGL